MKRALILLVVVLLIPAWTFAGGGKESASSKAVAGEIPSMTLRLGHIAEPSHPYARGGDYFADLVKKKSGGKIEIKTFHSSQLGDQKTLIEGLIYGTIDMALVGTAALGQFQPQISLFDLPFLFEDLDHAYKSLDTVGMDLGKALEPKGLKLLGYMENGVRHMTNNVREIKTPEDMKGLKIRVQTNKIFVSMMKALGASPTPMSLGELYTAMQQGVVDGQENPAAHIFPHRPLLCSGTDARLDETVERFLRTGAGHFLGSGQGVHCLAAGTFQEGRFGVLGQNTSHRENESDRGRSEALHGSHEKSS